MTDLKLIPIVEMGIKLSSWALEEASYYVHNMSPKQDDAGKLLDSSTFPPTKTYQWLLKERDKGNLKPLHLSSGREKFSPGTIMRHMENLDRHFEKAVQNAYLQYSKTGKLASAPSSSKQKQKSIYLEAVYILDQLHPGLSNTVLADLLHEMPKYLKQPPLATFAHPTIRKWIASSSIETRPAGRPRKGTPKPPYANEINWDELGKKLSP